MNGESSAGHGLAAAGFAAFAVGCCAAVPLIAAALGGLTAGAVFRVAVGAIALAVGTAVVLLIRSRRVCSRPDTGVSAELPAEDPRG